MYCLILSSKTNLKNAYASHMYCHAQAPHVRLTATASQCPSPAYSPTQTSISQGGQPKVIQFIYLLRHEMLMQLFLIKNNLYTTGDAEEIWDQQIWAVAVFPVLRTLGTQESFITERET